MLTCGVGEVALLERACRPTSGRCSPRSSGISCIRPFAPACDVWSRKCDSAKMTPAISAGSRPLSSRLLADDVLVAQRQRDRLLDRLVGPRRDRERHGERGAATPQQEPEPAPDHLAAARARLRAAAPGGGAAAAGGPGCGAGAHGVQDSFSRTAASSCSSAARSRSLRTT